MVKAISREDIVNRGPKGSLKPELLTILYEDLWGCRRAAWFPMPQYEGPDKIYASSIATIVFLEE
ncbi:hypothetical protein E4U53_000450 [Claviceps sorghi]|nr:hypothetical protein E4U53_000450 [Claviceps sorghi]